MFTSKEKAFITKQMIIEAENRSNEELVELVRSQ